MSKSLDDHFQFFSNLLNLIPLPKLQESDSESDNEQTENLKSASLNAIQTNISKQSGNMNGESVKLAPDKLWEKYQSKMLEFQGTRNNDRVKKRVKKEPEKKKGKTKMVKKTPKIKKKPVTTENVEGNEQDFQFSQLNFKTNLNLDEVMPRKRNYSKLFNRAEKKQKTLKELEEKDPTKAAKMIDSDQWEQMMGKVEGRKQRDDVKKLHKSWKKVQKRKQSSRKRMTERFDSQEKKIKEKQEKRSRHLQERKERKLKNKIKKRRNR